MTLQLYFGARGERGPAQPRRYRVVGTRSPSPYGKDMAPSFHRENRGTGESPLVSGLAYGIDTVAHRQALDKGGKTIAVLGSVSMWCIPGKIPICTTA